MNCFEVKSKYNYNIFQDGCSIGEIVLEMEPLIDKVRLSYVQYISGIKTNDYCVFLDRQNGYNVILDEKNLHESEQVMNLDCLFDNAQALFFLPCIGKNKCKINIFQKENKKIHSIVYNIFKEENGYIAKTVFPIQSFAKYNIDFSLKYFKNNNIKIVGKY